ncbi:hypothetical protein PPTG_22991 [Phytophthora nicotianae INRA-310]|uniref:Uncharacterized protein n=1 Tax=Phytophthora nicotianae (strain INRA-310) TaxID=761204 RepID=W2Q7P6_PHYN3|nr:hypothetical protein PPTG_22991 [Phytophthora nicotianae INRA-310]ETN08866.1 hypothetical protein PPTG_22991 [Phytophthora nicotianae INRA-310]
MLEKCLDRRVQKDVGLRYRPLTPRVAVVLLGRPVRHLRKASLQVSALAVRLLQIFGVRKHAIAVAKPRSNAQMRCG